MLPCLNVTNQRKTATKRIVLCWGFVWLSFLAIIGFGLVQKMQPAENTFPNHRVSTTPPEIQPKLVASYGKLPLSFEANQGQSSAPAKFLARGHGYALFLTGDEAVLTLGRASQKANRKSQNAKVNAGVAQHPRFGAAALPVGASSAGPRPNAVRPYNSTLFSLAGSIPESDNEMEKLRDQRGGSTLSSSRLADSGESSAVLRMRLVGANASAAVTGAEELPGKSNYFIGNDPKKWRTNVPNYAQVKYTGVYPGVDLVYYGNQSGQLEYDFVVTPGADPSVIALDVSAGLPRHADVGAGLVPAREGHPRGVPLRLAADGDLVVKTDGGEVRFHKPVVYQPAIHNGQRTTDNGRPSTEITYCKPTARLDSKSLPMTTRGRFTSTRCSRIPPTWAGVGVPGLTASPSIPPPTPM